MDKKQALHYHAMGRPGKIEVVPTKPHSTQYDLSLAYSPGVAEPCLEIQKNQIDAYKYTAKEQLGSRDFKRDSRTRTRRYWCLVRQTRHGRERIIV